MVDVDVVWLMWMQCGSCGSSVVMMSCGWCG